jgi:hypothetical protein
LIIVAKDVVHQRERCCTDTGTRANVTFVYLGKLRITIVLTQATFGRQGYLDAKGGAADGYVRLGPKMKGFYLLLLHP